MGDGVFRARGFESGKVAAGGRELVFGLEGGRQVMVGAGESRWCSDPTGREEVGGARLYPHPHAPAPP